MANIVVSVSTGVMKPVLDKLGVLMGDEYNKLKGLRKKVSFLEHELRAMNAFLEKMDASDEELDPQAKTWRKDIIEMSYDIEDYIDDFMDHVGEARDKEGILKKAYHYLETFMDRCRLANQFEEVKKRVMEASDRTMRYKFDECISNTTSVAFDPRLSALYKESKSLVGISSQKEELVKWVMDEEQPLKVMSIVGFGGLGKTTLANEVYRKVGAQFNCKAFVSVSQKPDMMRLFNSILSQIDKEYKYKDTSHLYETDIIRNIRKCLQDNRYFIVVDDLWDKSVWNNVISCAFPQNDQHSRVVITTRNEDVATSCASNHGYVHKMKPLSEKNSRKLFCNRIFGPEDKCPPEFKEVSFAILKKCGGLPLAIITVASILACQPTRLNEQWEYVQNSLASKSESTIEDMMHILELSYKNLPSSLKPCFLYLGTYPEDYKISKDELVRRWVAEGFVSNSLGRDIWNVAQSYFNELANRSMIQPAYEDDYTTRVSYCRVHDMMLELIVRKCKEDNFLSLANDPRMMAEWQNKVRRLTVDFNGANDSTTVRTSMKHLSRVRSITVFSGSKWIPPLQEFKSVRVLYLDITGRMEKTDLTAINQLSQLRYLKVTTVRVNSCKLQLGQIGSLRHLETLELPFSGCVIPSDIVDLPCLSHLVVKGYPGLPEGICKMKSLHTLNSFCLLTTSLENIEGLGQLTNLTELSIHSETYSRLTPPQGWMAALSFSLEKLSNLKCLVVKFNHYSAVLFDALSSWVAAPFRDLERLHLDGWIFSRVPRWLGDLHNLRDMWLWLKQMKGEEIGVIGMLPSLVKLHLGIAGVQTERIVIGGSSSTGFRLVKLFDFNCDKTSLLTFEAGAMPNLVNLRLNLHADGWDKGTPEGLSHLSNLKLIHLRVSADQELRALVRDVFQKAADALPGRPAITESFTISLYRPRLPDQHQPRPRTGGDGGGPSGHTVRVQPPDADRPVFKKAADALPGHPAITMSNIPSRRPHRRRSPEVDGPGNPLDGAVPEGGRRRVVRPITPCRLVGAHPANSDRPSDARAVTPRRHVRDHRADPDRPSDARAVTPRRLIRAHRTDLDRPSERAGLSDDHAVRPRARGPPGRRGLPKGQTMSRALPATVQPALRRCGDTRIGSAPSSSSSSSS